LLLGGTAALAGAAAAPRFETLRWIAPGTEYVALTSQPSTCLAFTPTLLGGQAAKAGLSCASCHINGRDNPHFLMNGVSERPGTADVSDSFFSAARENGKFDPVPIPDLALPGKVSRQPGRQALEQFIRDLIVDEFAGEEPSYVTLESLATYVRAIKACPRDDKAPVPRQLHDQLAIIKGALDVAGQLAARGDRKKEVSLLIAAARHQLGLISERYAGAKLKRERALLLKASRELQHVAESSNGEQALAAWQSRVDKELAERLFRKESLSLYNPERLRTLVAPQRESR
jgi:hypothetical protein